MHPVERNLAIARVTPASFASFRDMWLFARILLREKREKRDGKTRDREERERERERERGERDERDEKEMREMRERERETVRQ